MSKVIRIRQTRSTSQTAERQRETMNALGLAGIGTEVIRQDLRSIRGMLNKVQHLVEAEQLDKAPAAKTTRPSSSGYILG